MGGPGWYQSSGGGGGSQATSSCWESGLISFHSCRSRWRGRLDRAGAFLSPCVAQDLPEASVPGQQGRWRFFRWGRCEVGSVPLSLAPRDRDGHQGLKNSVGTWRPWQSLEDSNCKTCVAA